MSRQRVYVAEGEAPTDPQAVAFAKRLNSLLLAKGWRQSDLVRAAQQHMPEGQVFGRHLPSSYMRGKHMPNSINLEAMAKALGCKTTDLVPEGAATIVGHTDRAVQATMSTNGLTRLKLDMELPADIALQIMALAQKATAGAQ